MYMLNQVTLGANVHTGVFGSSFDPGILAQVLGAAGNYQGDFIPVIRQASKVGISLFDISALSAPALMQASLIYRGMVEGAVPGSTYISIASGSDLCFVVPQGISWSAGGTASLSLLLHFLSSNGSTAPITVGSTAGVQTAVSKVFAGNMGCVESINIGFGFDVRFCNDGFLYPRKVYIASQRPTLSITTNDESSLTTANLNPGAIGELSAVFAEVAEGGVRGTTRTYALTGHISRRTSGDRPGVTTVTCQGKGGFTIS
jgi:hypothetical protein